MSVTQTKQANVVARPEPPVEVVGKTRARFSAFTLALAGFLAVNAMCAFAVPVKAPQLSSLVSADLHSASVTGKSQSWWMTKAYLAQKRAPDIVLFGSSQMQCFATADAKLLGHDLDQIVEHGTVVLDKQLKERTGNELHGFNTALGGALISDHFMIERALFHEFSPKCVVIGISPRDFIDNCVPSTASTEPFQFFAPVVGVNETDNASFSDPFEKLDWKVATNVPLRRLRNYANIDDLLHGKDSSQTLVQDPRPFRAGVDDVMTLRPGQCSIPHQPFEGFIDNSFEYIRRYRKWRGLPVYAEQLRYLDRFLSDMNQRKIKVVLVGMPLDAVNRRLLQPDFWNDYRSRVSAVANTNGVTFNDLSNDGRFVHADFADGVHLNWRGATKLADVIASLI